MRELANKTILPFTDVGILLLAPNHMLPKFRGPGMVGANGVRLLNVLKATYTLSTDRLTLQDSLDIIDNRSDRSLFALPLLVADHSTNRSTSCQSSPYLDLLSDVLA